MDVGNHVDPVNHVDQKDQGEKQGGLLRLIACPHLAIQHDRIDRYVESGPTVAAHLRALGWNTDTLHARVFIDDELIEQARWEYAVPRAGQAFVTRVIPGEGGGKDVLRIVAMLGIVALALSAPYLIGAYGGLSGALFITTPGVAGLTSGLLSVAGSLRATSLLPARRV